MHNKLISELIHTSIQLSSNGNRMYVMQIMSCAHLPKITNIIISYRLNQINHSKKFMIFYIIDLVPNKNKNYYLLNLCWSCCGLSQCGVLMLKNEKVQNSHNIQSQATNNLPWQSYSLCNTWLFLLFKIYCGYLFSTHFLIMCTTYYYSYSSKRKNKQIEHLSRLKQAWCRQIFQSIITHYHQ